LSTAGRDDTSVDEAVAAIFAVISTVFGAGVEFKQDVGFEVDVVNGKAGCDSSCKHTSCDPAQKQDLTY